MGERLIPVHELPRKARRAPPTRTTAGPRVCVHGRLRLEPLYSHTRRRCLFCTGRQPLAAVRERCDAWFWGNLRKECRYGLVWLEGAVRRKCRPEVCQRGAQTKFLK